MWIAGIDTQSITFQTKAILLGLAVSLLLLPACWWIGFSKAQEYAALVDACKRESIAKTPARVPGTGPFDDLIPKGNAWDNDPVLRAAPQPKSAASPEDGPWKKYQSPNRSIVWDDALCSKEQSAGLDSIFRTKVQTELAYFDTGDNWLENYFIAAFFVMFLLRRLAELSRAIRGLD